MPTPVLQYLSLVSDEADGFAPRLALAIHRQSTLPGFLGSIEGAVMAKGRTWASLIVYATPADAEQSTRDLFESDYHAAFAQRVTEVESDRRFTPAPETLESMRGGRYARFAWIERFATPPAPEAWATFFARRRHLFHTMEGFEETFAFTSPPDAEEPINGIVSTWSDPRLLRAAADRIKEQHGTGDFRPVAEETIRITSSNLT